MSFENKVVLITGSGSGMGEATAILFAKKGANIVMVDYNEESANKTAEKCKEFGNKVLVIKTDISKDGEAKIAVEKTINEFGKLDVLVNNAGIVKYGNILSGAIMDTYDEILNTNLRAVVLMTTLAAPHLVKTKGCIVNTSSIVSKVLQKGQQVPAYTISKTGVDTFTRLSAFELAPSGVRVNAINPGPVRTNLFTNSGVEGNFDDYVEQTALKRVSDPSEIADLIVYLTSDNAKSITGSTITIDCGMGLL